jgi:hypothetical protein
MNYQDLVQSRANVLTTRNRIVGYIEELYNKDKTAAAQFRTATAKESVEGKVALDIAEFARKVRELAATKHDEDVENMRLSEIVAVVEHQRKTLQLDNKSNQDYVKALIKEEARRGLTHTEGTA